MSGYYPDGVTQANFDRAMDEAVDYLDDPITMWLCDLCAGRMAHCTAEGDDAEEMECDKCGEERVCGAYRVTG